MWLLPLLAGIIPIVTAQDSTTTTDSLVVLNGQSATSIDQASVPTGAYISYSSTITLPSSADMPIPTANGSIIASASGNSTSNSTTTTNSVMVLGGGGTATVSGSASSTSANSTSTPVVNTRPCNGYPEFCNRKYSNITMVTAHNSPFIKPGNAASNQALTVTSQLNDGVRMLQFQVHLVNGTLYLCHTSCDLLNVGTLESYLTEVAKWMQQNPYDVVTFLIGNFDQVDPGNFTAPIENSGVMNYVYTPSQIPMGLDDWPTLSSMILSGKRAVMFLDYRANQKKIPWLMDEFSQIWETPFSPTDEAFPCNAQRPPGLKPKDAENRMYLANHNLNVQVNFGSINLLIPDTSHMDVTNGVSGFGSLGSMAENCTRRWNRPPNFLLVDYYNYGNPNGSVFEVAAKMNHVKWNGNCCGKKSAASSLTPGLNAFCLLAIVAAAQFLADFF